MDASLRWHDEEMTKGCFYLRRIRDALSMLFPEIHDEPRKKRHPNRMPFET